MANRYWVGGTASWDGTAGTKWAATSNGPGGETVPTTADDVFFDASSTGTVTIASGNTGAKSINCTGFTGTITGTAGITVAGSITLVAGQTYTHTGTVTITGTGTLTTAGKSFSALTVNGSGITLTLGDALNIGTQTLTVTQGTLATANYNVTAGALSSSNSNTRTITLGSSTVTLSNFSAVDFSTATNLAFNANTSTITCTTYNLTFNGGGQTFYNVTIGNTLNNTHLIHGANTFNNLTFVDRANNGTNRVAFSANQTINGTLTVNGTQTLVYRRFWLRSNVPGTQRTISAAAINIFGTDFRDINAAGAATWSDSARAKYWGDTGNNSGITFATGRNAYWNLAGTQNWTANGWALTNNGTPAAENYPLVQDTATFTEAGAAGTVALDTQGLMIGHMTMADGVSNRSTAMTLSFGSVDQDNFFGNITLFSNLTVSGGGARAIRMSGYNVTQDITSSGKTLPVNLSTQDGYGNTVRLQDALLISSARTLSLNTQSSFNANNFNVTAGLFAVNNSATFGFSYGTTVKTLTMGSGTWTISGTGSVWSMTVNPDTFNKDTANIILSDTSTTARTFSGGGLSYNKLTIGGTTGTSTLTISGTNTFSELASTKTVAHTISFGGNQTIATWNVNGTSGNVVTVNSSAAGTRRTVTLTNATSGIDYLSIKDIGITDANRFYVGANSTDGGNNLNVVFSAAPITGTLAATDAQDASSISGDVAPGFITITGTLSATDNQDTYAVSGAIAHVGALDAADAPDEINVSGAIDHAGTLGANEDQDAAAFNGTVTRVFTLAGESAQTASACAVGAVAQIHLLSGSGAQEANAASAGATSQLQAIIGAGAATAAQSSAGAISQTQRAAGASVQSRPASAAGAVIQAQMLAGQSCSGINVVARLIGKICDPLAHLSADELNADIDMSNYGVALVADEFALALGC